MAHDSAEARLGLALDGGRDGQATIGGWRLDLREIQSALLAVLGVRAAVAAIRANGAGTSVLVCYFVGEASLDVIRSRLAERLPDGLVPLLVPLREMPTRASGEVDRAALPWPPPTPSVLHARNGAPQGDLATRAERWHDAADCEQPEPARGVRLHELFEASVDVRPEATALEFGELRMSYRELDERANQLAHRLLACGLQPGGRVGILVPGCLEKYTAPLAVAKAGGVYVPFDAGLPAERIGCIAADAGLALLILHPDLRDAAAGVTCPRVEVGPGCATESWPLHRPLRAENRDAAACYVIYTSGSTGRPKGVEVAHANIVNFLSVVRDVYRIDPSDRVYQGMSLAFDFAVEEIWVPWHAGATVVSSSSGDSCLGSELARFLIENRISVLCCVPTLLASLDRELPAIRTLLVGGEACPQELVERWGPGRRMLNTYGPTETTVTATVAELEPGKPITIGRPLPTYTVHILDEELRSVPDGECGELCIGGPGVALGYLHRPELTAERFIPDPYSPVAAARLFRSGDLARRNAEGEIEFLGRRDLQVKVRGCRVELGEIEAVLLEDPEVQAAAAQLHLSPTLGPEIAACVTCREGCVEEELASRLESLLRRRLPAGMMPAYLDLVADIPTLVSGKIDRNRLPEPRSRLGACEREYVAPASPLERELAELWAGAFGVPRVSVLDDFFLDLGGHSLAAARVVSAARTGAAQRGFSLAELYRHPTVRELAAHLEGQPQGSVAACEGIALPGRRASRLEVFRCGLLQALALYLIVALAAAPEGWLLVRFHGTPSLELLWMSLAVLVPWLVGFSALVPLVVARVALAGLNPGSYPLWGSAYLRVWLVRKLLLLSPLGPLSGSPLLPGYLRLLGARVGARCQIATRNLALPAFVSFGNDVSIGYGALLQPFVVKDGWLTIQPIEVDDGAFVGANAVVLAGAHLGERSGLGAQSLAAAGQLIPAGEWWAGSPSQRQDGPERAVARARRAPEAPTSWPLPLLAAFVVAAVGVELLPFAAIAAPLGLIVWAAASGGDWLGLTSEIGAAPLYVLSVCAIVAVGVRASSGGIREGVVPLRSGTGLRKWLVDKLLEASLLLTNTLYGTLYAVPWLRALGASVGPRAEISTLGHIDPVLLSLGSDSFAADLATIGTATFVDGRLVLARTEIEPGSFVGNAAFVPAGTTLQAGSLVGVHTLAPETVPRGSSWLGSPPIFLPRRQPSEGFPVELTFRPSRPRVAGRLAIEYLRVTLPSVLVGSALYLGVLAELVIARGTELVVVLALTPLVMFAAGILVTISAAALKWLLVGRYRPRVEPLWATFVRRSELATALYEAAAVPALVEFLTGTPLMRPALRLFGARIGRRVCLDTTYLTEFDLVSVGDDAAVGALSSLQTHLFEDRVMKMSRVELGAASSVGSRTVVLYDSHVSTGASLDALSLAMKGETLPAHTSWRGIPAGGEESLPAAVLPPTSARNAGRTRGHAPDVRRIPQVEGVAAFVGR